MSERYPNDTALLALTEDAATGVEYIPTGTTPYYLEFRKLLQRTLLAAERANDLRAYEDGDLSIGVRPGRCVIGNSVIGYAGSTLQSVTNNTTTYVYIDAGGTLQLSTSAMPTDRTAFIPIAEVVAAAGVITSIVDRRGEAFLAVPDNAHLNLPTVVHGVVHAVGVFEGDLTASQTDQLIGVVPIDGQVVGIILSVGANIDSDTDADSLTATAKVNGTALATVDPKITDLDGTGFRSTAQGDGTAATLKTDGTELVTKGDVLTVDLTRTVIGTVTGEFRHVVVLIVVEPSQQQ
ncbi:MAG: hypothetical protein CMJ49_13215 [Planctomycetaceae bacterium]|nr:hypothetical protein [Planctomycetaceae bacterium]